MKALALVWVVFFGACASGPTIVCKPGEHCDPGLCAEYILIGTQAALGDATFAEDDDEQDHPDSLEDYPQCAGAQFAR